MRKIIVTTLETHEPILGLFSQRAPNPIMVNGEDKRRFLTRDEVRMLIAGERAGVTDNILNHGYSYHFDVCREEHVFVNLKPRDYVIK